MSVKPLNGLHTLCKLADEARDQFSCTASSESGRHTSHAPPSQKSDSGGSGRSSLVSITIDPKASLLVSPSFVFVLLHSVCNLCLLLRGKADLLDDLTDKECTALASACLAGCKRCREANV